ncbi:hypothetical protein chiPu_0008649 [Chiloscyllium punctatum]|uniref:Murine leukemia virus integrase C-terminal domain-containing protein n=1 Tax=Chiloscyllium punctatum TaxID=137246 RepID=A0A401SII4_CHIPU|nr:hypothetical protein [Chiloscyllium punctatum]
MTNLSPHEMLAGKPMPVPVRKGPYDRHGLKQLELELKQQLTTMHESIHTQEKLRKPESGNKEGLIKPGGQVYIRVFQRKWNEPRREGPFTVIKASPTAIQVEGQPMWYHLNHCTRVLPQAQTDSGFQVCEGGEVAAMVGRTMLGPVTPLRDLEQSVSEACGGTGVPEAIGGCVHGKRLLS